MPLRDGRIGLAKGLIRHVRRGTRQVQASHKVSAVFDDPNLIGSAGLVPVMPGRTCSACNTSAQEHLECGEPQRWGESGRGHRRDARRCRQHRRPGVLRHGGMTKVFGAVKAPSTYGTFLRSFTSVTSASSTRCTPAPLAGLAKITPRLLRDDAMAFLERRRHDP